MKLSASIYSKHTIDLVNSLAEFDNYAVDYIHIDCNDELSVFNDISALNSLSKIPIDLHIVSNQPEVYYEAISNNTIHRVSFQIEEICSTFVLPQWEQTKVGLAIQISTPDIVQIITSYYSQLDFVLLMTTTPGKSGGVFSKESFKTIREVISLFPEIDFCIDGGINHEIAYILRLLGAESIVIGNYLMNHQNMAAAILTLRSRMVRSDFIVSDYMIPCCDLPIVNLENDSFMDMIQKMDHYRLGIVFCIDNKNEFKGIITNADIRKKLLTREFHYEMSLCEIVNNNPQKISNKYNTSEMLEFISKINFPILVLPVVDEFNNLAGAISFHSLTKGD